MAICGEPTCAHGSQVLLFGSDTGRAPELVDGLAGSELRIDWVSTRRDAELLLENVCYGLLLVEVCDADDRAALELLREVTTIDDPPTVVVLASDAAAAAVQDACGDVRVLRTAAGAAALDLSLLAQTVRDLRRAAAGVGGRKLGHTAGFDGGRGDWRGHG